MCHQRITNGTVQHALKLLWKRSHSEKRQTSETCQVKDLNEPDKYIDHVYGEREAEDRMDVHIWSSVLKLDFQMDIGTTAYPELTKDFLSIVNLTLVSCRLYWRIYLMNHKTKNLRVRKGGTEDD